MILENSEPINLFRQYNKLLEQFDSQQIDEKELVTSEKVLLEDKIVLLSGSARAAVAVAVPAVPCPTCPTQLPAHDMPDVFSPFPFPSLSPPPKNLILSR